MDFKHFNYGELNDLSDFFLSQISNDFKSMGYSDLDRGSFKGGGFYLKDDDKLVSLGLYASNINKVFINHSTPFIDSIDKNKVGYMGLAWVDKSMRGGGFQKKLVGLRENQLKVKNIGEVVALVDKGNIASFKSFSDLGYDVVDELFIDGVYSRSIFYKNIRD